MTSSQAELSSLGETLIPVIDKLQQILHGVRVTAAILFAYQGNRPLSVHLSLIHI